MATLVFMDFETQSEADLTITGGLKYALDTTTRALLLSWAIGNDEPVKLWCPNLSNELVPEVWAMIAARMTCVGSCPPDIVEALKQPDGYLVAHNMGFDRAIWQQVAVPDNGFPEIRIEQTLDTQSQFQASNLPGQLEWAGRALGIGHKTVGGKAIMQRFARRQDPEPGSRRSTHRVVRVQRSRRYAAGCFLERDRPWT